MLIVLLAVKFSLLPSAGRGGGLSYVLPVLTLAMAPAAVLARFTRSALLETLGSDYVVTARPRGRRSWSSWAATPCATPWCRW